MKKQLFFVLLALFILVSNTCLIAIAQEEEAEKESDVIVLKDANFSKMIEEKTDLPWFIEFYAPWCKHCSEFAPLYEEIATAFKGRAYFAKVNAEESEIAAESFQIPGFPSIFFIKDGKLFYYRDARTLQAFEDFFVKDFSQEMSREIPPVFPYELGDKTNNEFSDVIVLNDSNFDSFVVPTEPWLVEFYAPWCKHCLRLAGVYEQVATKLKGKVNVAKVNVEENSELQERFEINSFPTIKLFVNGEMRIYSGIKTVESFEQFVESGFMEASSEVVPPPRTEFQKIWSKVDRYRQIAEGYIYYRVWPTVGAVFGAGVLLGMVWKMI